MKPLARWSVCHARALWRAWAALSRLAMPLAPALRRLGLNRVEGWLLPVERRLKGALFDCRMCGQCELSATGMACPCLLYTSDAADE